jgi:hypothetical protein
MHFANTRLDEAIETRPLPAMAQGDKVLFPLYELLFQLIAQRFGVPEPCAEASVVALGWTLKSI